MGSRAQAKGRVRDGRRRRRIGLSALLAVLVLLLAAPAANATFHEISIREVYAGSVSAPQSSYVEVQMYAAGQEQVGGRGIDLFEANGMAIDANGAAAGTTLTFPSALTPAGVNQQAILIGDDGVHAAFPSVTPDLENAAFNVPAAGGAACWAGSIDCVSWGTFSGSLPSSAGTPADPGGIPTGMAIRRDISHGSCANLLDIADDTGDSLSDFDDVSPAPVSYATVPSPQSCNPPPTPPTVEIDTKPPATTKSEGSMEFTFHSVPSGAPEFDCRLDAQVFAACDSGSVSYPGPLSEASHTFQVKATNVNGTGPAASYTWTIDRTPPDTNITQHPVDESAGLNATFKFSSTQAGSKFECKLSPADASFALCNAGNPTSTTKVYPSLADGTYNFEVRAIDPAGNTDPTAASFEWEVDNSKGDKTPPETTIKSHPTDPTESPVGAFTYESTETNSTFECKLDSGAFASCPPGGVSYEGLAPGPHSFQVKAKDEAGNTDASPAGFSWTVTTPAPHEEMPPPPPPEEKPTPDTRITTKPPAKTRDRTPTLKFKATVAGATYQCKLDGQAYKPCRSPLTTKTLRFGRHTVKVRAIAGGITDPSPAAASFKVVKAK